MAVISEPERLQLTAAPLSVEVVPDIGGGLASFRLNRDGKVIDLMRPLAPEQASRPNPVDMAMFPMAPYANRIAGNRFTFRGRDYHFAPNNPPERFNVHGTAWHRPWAVTARSERQMRLALGVEDVALYSYEATQDFSLDDEGLTVAMTLTNRGAMAMPFGFGQHPWFPRDADTELRFTARLFWLEGPDGVPSDRITLPPELDFSRGQTLPQGWRNNCYSGWSGRAEIIFPARRVRISITADPVFGHLMLYADPTKPFFCLEPQSNASGALDRLAAIAEHGLIVLEPGESVGGAMRFNVEQL